MFFCNFGYDREMRSRHVVYDISIKRKLNWLKNWEILSQIQFFLTLININPRKSFKTIYRKHEHKFSNTSIFLKLKLSKAIRDSFLKLAQFSDILSKQRKIFIERFCNREFFNFFLHNNLNLRIIYI